MTFTEKLNLRQEVLRLRYQSGSSAKSIREVVEAALGEDEAAPERRPRDYSEWKAQKAAREAAGGSINLVTVGLDGKPVRNTTPIWSEYVARERAAGRLPERSIIEIARSRGTPIRDRADYRRVKLELEGGHDAE